MLWQSIIPLEPIFAFEATASNSLRSCNRIFYTLCSIWVYMGSLEVSRSHMRQTLSEVIYWFLPSVRTAFEIMETPQQTYSQNIEYLHVNLSCFQSIEINVLMSLERIPIRIFHFFWILYPETAQMVPRYGIWFQNFEAQGSPDLRSFPIGVRSIR